MTASTCPAIPVACAGRVTSRFHFQGQIGRAPPTAVGDESVAATWSIWTRSLGLGTCDIVMEFTERPPDLRLSNSLIAAWNLPFRRLLLLALKEAGYAIRFRHRGCVAQRALLECNRSFQEGNDHVCYIVANQHIPVVFSCATRNFPNFGCGIFFVTSRSRSVWTELKFKPFGVCGG